MPKFFNFLMVGLFLIPFQVVEVEAQRGDRVDTRDTRGGDSVDTRDPREELRATLKNCRQMKKAGKLTKAMKRECKAARQLKKKSRQ